MNPSINGKPNVSFKKKKKNKKRLRLRLMLTKSTRLV